MDAEFLRGFLRLGVFIGGCGIVMAFVQPPGSPEFILSVCSGAMGLALIGGVLTVARFLRRRDGG
jgi:hypothetical protein